MKTQSKRLYYIDWLRILAFGLLFLFHSWRPFDHLGWNIKNNEQSILFDLLTAFVHGWRMDLIFLISGVGTWFALNIRKSDFFSDRVKRLIVPFIFGILLIIPPQKYIEAISFHGYPGNYFDFLKDWPGIAFSFNFGSSLLIWFGHLGAHLYYLPFLFVITVPVILIYQALKKTKLPTGQIKSFFIHPWRIFLLVLPVMMARFLLKPLYPMYTDWADFFAYLWMFVYGFVFIKEEKFIEIIKKLRWLFLNLGLLSSAIMIYLYYIKYVGINQHPQFGIKLLVESLVSSVISFSWVLFFVALAAKYLNFGNKWLQPLNIAILPVYILHQTLIIVFGFFIIRTSLHLGLKFALIYVSAISVSVLLYLLIKRFDFLRFVFGMKPLEKKEKIFQIAES